MNDETQLIIKKLIDIISPVVRSGRAVSYNAIVGAVIWELREGALESNGGCISHAARQLNLKRTCLQMAMKHQFYKKTHPAIPARYRTKSEDLDQDQ